MVGEPFAKDLFGLVQDLARLPSRYPEAETGQPGACVDIRAISQPLGRLPYSVIPVHEHGCDLFELLVPALLQLQRGTALGVPQQVENSGEWSLVAVNVERRRALPGVELVVQRRSHPLQVPDPQPLEQQSEPALLSARRFGQRPLHDGHRDRDVQERVGIVELLELRPGLQASLGEVSFLAGAREEALRPQAKLVQVEAQPFRACWPSRRTTTSAAPGGWWIGRRSARRTAVTGRWPRASPAGGLAGGRWRSAPAGASPGRER